MTAAPPDRPHVALAIGGLHGVSGGAERVLVDLANGLHRRGFRVSVLTYQDRSGPSFYPLDYGIARFDGRRRHARGRGSTLQSLDGPARRRRSVAVAKWLVQYGPKVFRLRRLVRTVRPDLVIGFLPSTFTYMELALTGMRVKSIASIHNVPTRELGGDSYRWDQNPVDIALRRRALRTADATTVLLPSFLEQLDPGVRATTAVIPNSIEPHIGSFADVSDCSDNVILAVGRFAPAKDHETLIRAWARLEADHPSWRVRIIGDGPLRNDLVALIADLGVERVELEEPRSEIVEAYTSSKILAMPSIHEGFGLVTAEALACGLPVIGFTDCEGTNEIVLDERNGLLVDPGDDRAGAFATALRRLMIDEQLRLGLAERSPSTIERFDPSIVMDQWESVIRSVLDGSDLPGARP